MTETELTRSELVHAMVSVGTLLTGPKPLKERLDGLCVAAAYVLQCDHINIMVIDGDRYRGAFGYGYAPEILERLPEYTVSRTKPIIHEIEATESYLLINDAKTDPRTARIAGITDIESVVIVPFTHPDGEPLGYLTVDYLTNRRSIGVEQAELAMGMARIAQTTLLRDHESQRRREISEALITVEEKERRRLSSELHDDPLQRMLALRLGLEALESRTDDPELRADLARLIEQCRTASQSLREVMVRTHPTAAELVDLQSTLRTLVARMAVEPAITFEFADHRTQDTPDYVTAALNRIAEQGVRNALQHAKARTLTVTLRDESLGSSLSMVDDGDGFDPHNVEVGHLGLVSMRERTDSLGGSFQLTTGPGEGTAITVWLPHR